MSDTSGRKTGAAVTSGGMGRPAFLAAIAAGRDRLIDRARAAGPSSRVPMSSRWTVRDLVVHVGNVHEWAASVLRTGREQPQVFDAPPAGAGPGFDALLVWYAARADGLLDLLTGPEVPDDAPVWTFGPPGTAAFWPRRQAHEVTMHALDAALAAGEDLSEALLPLDPVMCADGVGEIVDVMLPRVAMFVPRPAMSGRMALAANDTGSRWELERDGQIDSAATGSGVAATLFGPASSLFALLWRRARLDKDAVQLAVEVDGDHAVVDALLAARLTP